MAEELRPDICVIGGGPGGIAAASAAASAGISVVLVEKARLGGNDLVAGGVPSKALLAAAETCEALRIGPALGVSGAPLQVNLNRVREHIVAVTEAFARSQSAERLALRGITVIEGEARFVGRDRVVAGGRSVSAGRFILAVGAERAAPPLPGPDAIETMTFADAFDLGRRPSHLIVLGADRYALELAQAYARLGIDTTVLDTGAALAGEDAELAAVVVDRLRADGIRIRTGVTIHQIARRRAGIRVLVTDPGDNSSVGTEIAVDGSHLLLAGRRAPATAGLGLEVAGIRSGADGILVDANLMTTNRRVYAIGDAVAGPPSVARAELHARAVVKSILYRVARHGDDTLAPRVTFTDPGLAAVGLDEAAARRRYGDVQVLRFPFVENARARIERQPDGVIKVIATLGGRVLGAGIVGRDAAELIAPWTLAVTNRLTLTAMAGAIAGFPTRAAAGAAVAGQSPTVAAPRLMETLRRRMIAVLMKIG